MEFVGSNDLPTVGVYTVHYQVLALSVKCPEVANKLAILSSIVYTGYYPWEIEIAGVWQDTGEVHFYPQFIICYLIEIHGVVIFRNCMFCATKDKPYCCTKTYNCFLHVFYISQSWMRQGPFLSGTSTLMSGLMAFKSEINSASLTGEINTGGNLCAIF